MGDKGEYKKQEKACNTDFVIACVFDGRDNPDCSITIYY